MFIKPMSRFHQLKIKKITKETPDCISVTFEVPEEKKNIFNFIQGQFLTFRREIDGEEIRRSYSICSCVVEEDLSVAIKILPDGKFSSFANKILKPGDLIEVMPPSGRFFTDLSPSNKKRYVAIAAGSGITPVISLVKTILITEKNSEIVLIYGNRDKNSIIFKSQLDSLKNKNMDRLSIFHIFSREQGDTELFSGRIDKKKINYFLEHIIDPKLTDEVFICGPEEMIMETKEAFLAKKIDPKHIHFELFTPSGQIKILPPRTHGAHSDEISKVNIRVDGINSCLEVYYEGESILEAALRNGADLPYACKSGVCTTCRAKLENGEVYMDVNYGLEPEEIENGFILSCQAHPRSRELSLNFDMK
jgi:ring-1,2-phenylacetyl-CoA epoxidase subunit PaaE